MFEFHLILCLSEEILKRDNAVWISPDGEKLVFATFNDTMVDEVTWKIYGSPIDGVTNPYPQEGRLRYPKVITIEMVK